MKLAIGHKSIRVFAKTLRFMAKYSNELFLQGTPNQLLCKVVNHTQTAVIQATFEDLFFMKYELSEDKDDNMAKVPFRPLLNCVKNCKNVS